MKSVASKVGFLLTSTLVLTGCVYGYVLQTPASCPATVYVGEPPVEQTIDLPLEINLSDQTPGEDEPFSISVFREEDVQRYSLSRRYVNSLVVVDQATGFYRAEGFNAVTANIEASESPSPGATPSASPSFDPAFVGFPLSPTPSPSADPSQSPESGEFSAPSEHSNASVFMPFSNGGATPWWSPTSSLKQKLNIVESSEQNNEYGRVVMPGIISVRCAEDAIGTIRAAKEIFPNYLDNLSPIQIAADPNSTQALTGTLTLPAEISMDGFLQAGMFVDDPTALNAEYSDSISSLWLKFLIAQESGAFNASGSPLLLLGDSADQLNVAAYNNRTVTYTIGTLVDNGLGGTEPSVVRPAAGEYLMFMAFSDQEMLGTNMKTAFFKVIITETGNQVEVQSLANYGLEIGSTPAPIEPAAVISSVHPSITSVVPAEVSVAGGTKVTVTGTHLSGASVLVGNLPAALVSNTDGLIEFVMPPSASAKLGLANVKVTTDAGELTLLDSLTYVKARAAAVLRPVVRKVSGFAGGSASVPASQKASVKRITSEAANFDSATCIGYSAGGIKTAADRALAVGRAKAVCAKLKAANPSLKVRVTASAEDFGMEASARKVEIMLSR